MNQCFPFDKKLMTSENWVNACFQSGVLDKSCLVTKANWIRC